MPTQGHSTAWPGVDVEPQAVSLEPTALLSGERPQWRADVFLQAGEGTVWLLPAGDGQRGTPAPDAPQRSPEDVQRECALRAKGRIRRSLRANRARYMWTFTTARPVYSYDQLAELADKLLRRMAEAGYRGYFLLVPEPHPGGHGWHLHGATNRYLPIKKVRAWWRAGHVFVVGPRGRQRSAWSSRRLASYLAKYVTKGLDENELHWCLPRPPGAHRYWVTQGYEPVATTRYFNSLAIAMEWLRRHVGQPERVVPFGQAEAYRPEGYWLSWPEAVWRVAPGPGG